MEVLFKNKVFQCVICLQDHKSYIYNVKENSCVSEDDFARIKCFQVKEDGKPDFSKEIEIYRKYLINGSVHNPKLQPVWRY
jgi:hypothetical protein